MGKIRWALIAAVIIVPFLLGDGLGKTPGVNAGKEEKGTDYESFCTDLAKAGECGSFCFYPECLECQQCQYCDETCSTDADGNETCTEYCWWEDCPTGCIRWDWHLSGVPSEMDSHEFLTPNMGEAIEMASETPINPVKCRDDGVDHSVIPIDAIPGTPDQQVDVRKVDYLLESEYPSVTLIVPTVFGNDIQLTSASETGPGEVTLEANLGSMLIQYRSWVYNGVEPTDPEAGWSSVGVWPSNRVVISDLEGPMYWSFQIRRAVLIEIGLDEGAGNLYSYGHPSNIVTTFVWGGWYGGIRPLPPSPELPVGYDYTRPQQARPPATLTPTPHPTLAPEGAPTAVISRPATPRLLSAVERATEDYQAPGEIALRVAGHGSGQLQYRKWHYNGYMPLMEQIGLEPAETEWLTNFAESPTTPGLWVISHVDGPMWWSFQVRVVENGIASELSGVEIAMVWDIWYQRRWCGASWYVGGC